MPITRDWGGRWVRIAAAAPLLVLGAQGAPANLRYVANAGALVAIGGVQVLIDAPIREGIRRRFPGG